jgi:hypothetical protein
MDSPRHRKIHVCFLGGILAISLLAVWIWHGPAANPLGREVSQTADKAPDGWTALSKQALASPGSPSGLFVFPTFTSMSCCSSTASPRTGWGSTRKAWMPATPFWPSSFPLTSTKPCAAIWFFRNKS